MNTLIVGGNNNCVKIFNLNTLSEITSFHKHTSAIKAVACRPKQSKLIATGGGVTDKHILLCNLKTGKSCEKIHTEQHISSLN